jgi:hypothetical protein
MKYTTEGAIFFQHIALTISTMVQPYNSLYETIFKGKP